ncbi:MAG: hypothetical protein ABWZ88_22500 [Variovorax sp.]
MSSTRFTDVSLTDGQSARWDGGMTTPMALAAATALGAAASDVIEVASSATFTQCVARGEAPWQRVDRIRERCPRASLRASLSLLTAHGKRGIDVVPTDVATLWLREMAQRGVSEVLLLDPLMRRERMAPVLAAAASLGMVAIAALPFSASSAHSDAGFQAQAAALVAWGATRVMLRDEGSLLTPERLEALLPALRRGLGGTPLDLHLRCQTALGPMMAIEAVRLGIDGLDTCFAPLANGPSAPALGTLLKSLRMLQVGSPASAQQLHAVREADRLLSDMAERHGYGPARAWAFDLAPYAHQLPGEVAAQSMKQLAEAGLMHLLHAFAAECARIRADLGSPPMLAPFARPIAEQALLHVRGMDRYAELRPGVRRALQQVHGAMPTPVDARLARRVGGVPPVASRNDAMRAAHPDADDAAWVAATLCGVEPEALPPPAPAQGLRYLATRPEDALIAGLTRRAATWAALLEVRGPGVSIQLQGNGG